MPRRSRLTPEQQIQRLQFAVGKLTKERDQLRITNTILVEERDESRSAAIEIWRNPAFLFADLPEIERFLAKYPWLKGAKP